MSRTSILILLGILTILTPFSGLPSSLRTLLAIVFGASVAAIGLMLRASEAKALQQAAEPTSALEDSPATSVSAF